MRSRLLMVLYKYSWLWSRGSVTTVLVCVTAVFTVLSAVIPGVTCELSVIALTAAILSSITAFWRLSIDGLWKRDTNRTLKELDGRTAERQITDEQKGRFLDVLRDSPPGNVSVVYVEADTEASRFAGRIVDLLNRAKWRVSGPSAVPKKELEGIGGLVIFVREHDKLKRPPWVEPLSVALSGIDSDSQVHWCGDLVGEPAQIYVGPKSQPEPPQ